MSFFKYVSHERKLKPQTKCLKCGSDKLATGGLEASCGVLFSVDKRSEKNGKVKVSLTRDFVPVENSSMCLDCGFIELGGCTTSLADIKKEYFKD